MNKKWYYKINKNDIKDFHKEKMIDVKSYTDKDGSHGGYIDNFMYIGYRENYKVWGYMFCDKRSLDFYDENGYKYCGEFIPLRKLRKDKLNKINEL